MVNIYHPRRFGLFSFVKRDDKRSRLFVLKRFLLRMMTFVYTCKSRPLAKKNLMLIFVILSPIILHTSKITNVVLNKINDPFLFFLQFKTPVEDSLYKITLFFLKQISYQGIVFLFFF